MVPISIQNLSLYIGLLSNSLKYNSIPIYLNIVRLLHLEAGLQNPVDSWSIKMLLKGTKRVLGCEVVPKEPVTPALLLKIHALLDLSCPMHIVFWAATLTGFFGMLRKSNLFPSQQCLLNNKFVKRSDFKNHKWGLSMTITWSKTIQYSERLHTVALPSIDSLPPLPSEGALAYVL